MPGNYPPLTPKEKQEIIDRHRYLVDRMNENLPEGMKLQYDPDLPKRLDDPSVVGIYRIGQDMKVLREKQNQIHQNLEERFGRAAKGNPLTRTIQLGFDTSGTPEAEAYNEKLYRDYLEDPGKIVHMRYGNVMNVNPKAMYECGDDPLKLAEYYRDTYPQCEEAFNFVSVINNGDPTPEMKSALASLTKPMETISYPCTTLRAAESIDYLACPKMTLEQSLMVQATGRELLAEEGEPLRMAIVDIQNKETMESPHSFFGKFEAKGFEFEEGMFVKHRPESFEIGEDGRPTNIKEVSYDRYFQARPEDHIRIRPRRDNNLNQVKAMTRSFQQNYQKQWQKVFNEKRGFHGEFDLNQIETQHQGGFMERHIFGSTSPEYLAFMQALKDFHDPQSTNYLNQDNLKDKGNAYLQHKADQGYTKLEDMKGTSLIRAKLVLNTIEACNQTKMENVEASYFPAYKSASTRESFLSADDVEEDGLESEELVDEMINNLDNEMDGPERSV